MGQAPPGKHLLAVSGGVDSMVLATLYHQAGIRMGIAHCNFQLRGSESAADQAFVSNWAHERGIPFFTINFATRAYQKNKGLSLQMAARELRYSWFDALLQLWGFSTVVTAHHLDDQLETFLIQLGRGQGMEGLGGIPQKTEMRWRPLLEIPREQILTYSYTHQIPWREDSSNRSKEYQRNALRHEVIPAFKSVHPQFLEAFQSSLGYIQQAQAYLVHQAEQFKLQWFKETPQGFRIPNEAFVSGAFQEPLWHHLFYPFGFKANEVCDLLQSPAGKFLEHSSTRLIREREGLFLETLFQSPIPQSIPNWEALIAVEEPFVVLSDSHWPEKIESHEAYLDKEMLKFPLTLRTWQKGDYFYPTAMQGRKLVSKYFKDLKFNTTQKQTQLLLLSQDKIVWVVGHRCDRRFVATPETPSILALKTSSL